MKEKCLGIASSPLSGWMSLSDLRKANIFNFDKIDNFIIRYH